MDVKHHVCRGATLCARFGRAVKHLAGKRTTSVLIHASAAVNKGLKVNCVSDYPAFETIFTDGSKSADGVAAAAVSSKMTAGHIYPCHLPDNSSSVIVELRAVFFCSLRRLPFTG